MGFFDLFKSKNRSNEAIQPSKQETVAAELVSPVAIDPTQLAEEKKNADLEKLKAFENKIRNADPKSAQQSQIVHEVQQRVNVALKIKNPFRGY